MPGMGPSPPTPQNPTAVANAQAQYNVGATTNTLAAQHGAGQINPYGSLTPTIMGYSPEGVPLYQTNLNLSPEQQQILNNLQGSQIGLGGAAGNLVGDTSSMYSQAPDFSEAAGTQTNINMARQLEYLRPFQEQQTEQLDNQLRNQGLTPGTEAYDRAIRTLRDNQSQSVMSFLNQTQPLAFNQAVTQYNQPLQTIGSILGMSQPSNLNASLLNTPRPTVGAADYTGATANYNQAIMQNYQAQVAQYNALMKGIMGVGTAAINPFGPLAMMGV